jgi:DNA primase
VLPGHKNADQGKYWNSPESPIFAKSRLLYGLEAARDAIRQTGMVVVVEGYTDCIVAHQCGVLNVVGTLGTALTEMHVTMLKRFARKVVLVYDGDQAGQNATERALARFLAQEIDLRVLTLPGELDPADALLEQGKEWFEDQLSRAVEVWEYKLRCVLERHGLDSVDACHRVLEEMLQTMAEVPVFGGATVVGPWQVREDLLLGRLSQRLGLPEKSARDRLAELRKERARRAEAADRPAARPQGHTPSAQFQRLMRRPTKDEQIECELLQILFSNPETVSSIRREIHPEDFQQPHLKALLELCFHLADDEQSLTFERLMSHVEDPSLKQLVAFLDEQGRKKTTPDLLDHLLFCVRQRRELDAAANLGTVTPIGQTIESRLESKASLRRAAELASAREEMKASRKRVTKQ